jgi:chromosome partitioning protein
MDALRAMRDQHGDHLWARVIPVDTQFREASRAGVPISIHAHDSHGAEAYASLLRWLLREKQSVPRVAAQ